MTSGLIVIDAPHFYAGVDIEEGKVVVAAPIVHYMVGWKWFQVTNYCRKKGWKFERRGC